MLVCSFHAERASSELCLQAGLMALLGDYAALGYNSAESLGELGLWQCTAIETAMRQTDE